MLEHLTVLGQRFVLAIAKFLHVHKLWLCVHAGVVLR